MKALKIFLITFVILIAVAITTYFVFFRNNEDSSIDYKFYDENGNEIDNAFSIINNQNNVFSMRTIVKIKNTANVAAIFTINETLSSPQLWVNGFNNNCDRSILINNIPQNCITILSIYVQPQQSITWESALVKTQPFESTTPTNLTLAIIGDFGIQKLTKIASTNILIKPNLEANFDINLTIG